MKDKYESEMLQVLHEDMKGMHKAGIINDGRMCEFDEMCLVKEPETKYTTPKQVLEHAIA